MMLDHETLAALAPAQWARVEELGGRPPAAPAAKPASTGRDDFPRPRRRPSCAAGALSRPASPRR